MTHHCKNPEERWFDRTFCPEPCGSMHYRCNEHGMVLDCSGCLFEEGMVVKDEPQKTPLYVEDLIKVLNTVAEWAESGDVRSALESVVLGLENLR